MRKMKRWAKVNAAAWFIFILAMAEHLEVTELWQFYLALGVEVVVCWLIWKSLTFAFSE